MGCTLDTDINIQGLLAGLSLAQAAGSCLYVHIPRLVENSTTPSIVDVAPASQMCPVNADIYHLDGWNPQRLLSSCVMYAMHGRRTQRHRRLVGDAQDLTMTRRVVQSVPKY